MPTEKRARKKEARDAQLAALAAARRRQRIARLVGIAAVAVVVIVFALLADDGGDEKAKPAAAGGKTKGPAEVACDAQAPPPADPQQYGEPKQVTKPGVDYRAVIQTSCGEISVDLLEEKAPETVNNFVFLARDGFYDGLIWHRIVEDFVIQSGDPDGINGNEPDGPGYNIPDELPEKSSEYIYGVMAMANAGPNTGGSQFFIVVHKGAGGEPEPAGLQPDYSIFGVTDKSSYETLDKIAAVETGPSDNPAEAELPVNPIYIESVKITEK